LEMDWSHGLVCTSACLESSRPWVQSPVQEKKKKNHRYRVGAWKEKISFISCVSGRNCWGTVATIYWAFTSGQSLFFNTFSILSA
jgi:hypothetical protein